MTFSGELFTWLTNTMKSMAREALKFDLRPGHAMAGSGDDTERQAGRSVSDTWILYEDQDVAVEKREESDVGSFCSFNVVRGIVYKDPILLFKRLMGKLSMGDVDNVALGYLDLAAQNYALGDIIYDVMSPDELAHHSAFMHVMFNLKKWGYTGPKIDYSRLTVENYDNDVPTISQVNSVVAVIDHIVAKPGEILSDSPSYGTLQDLTQMW
jgi:hypothetical protein